MKIQDYIEILWRRKWIIAITTTVVLAMAALGATRISREYTATAKIRLLTTLAGSSEYITYDLKYTDRLMNTYLQLSKRSSVRERLAERLGVELDELPVTDVSFIPNTEIFEVKAIASSAAEAEKGANAMAELLVEEEFLLLYPSRFSQGVPSSEIIEPAAPPKNPSSMNIRTLLMLGAVIGMAGGAGLAIMFETVDTRLHNARHVTSTLTLPLLGAVPFFSPRNKGKTSLSDIFLRLAITLSKDSAKHRSIVVASALPGEGRTLVISELANAFTDLGRKVVVVDANLNKPAMHTSFQLENQKGLSDILQGAAKLDEVIQTVQPDGLRLVTAGTVSANPARLLAMPAMASMLKQLMEDYDVVLVDTPALLSSADALLIAPLVTQVIVLISIGQTNREALLSIQQQLVDSGANVIGMVANLTNRQFVGSYNYAQSHNAPADFA